MGLKLNPGAMNQVFRVVEDAWAEVVAAVDVEFERVIEDEGAFPDFPGRDIVDTGRFRDSQQVDVQARRALWLWAPHSPENGYCYAMALYYGFYAYGGSKWIEGRPWVDVAIKNINPVVLLAAGLTKRGLLARIMRQNQMRIG